MEQQDDATREIGKASGTMTITTTITPNDDEKQAGDETISVAAALSDDSLSSSSSEEEEEEEEEEEDNGDDNNNKWHSLTLMERRARKIARNEAKLNSLGLTHLLLDKRKKRSGPRTRQQQQSPEQGNHVAVSPQGMLLCLPEERLDANINSSSKTDTTDPLAALRQGFPGREKEIRALYAQLDFSLGQAHYIVPAPLWITGTPGTGKSVVTRAVLQSLQKQHQSRTTTTTTQPAPIVCYVCPEALPPPLSVEGLVSLIYKLVWEQLGFTDSTMFVNVTMRKKRRREQSAAPSSSDQAPLSSTRILRQRGATIDYTANTGNKTKSKTSRVTAQDMAESIAPKLSKAYTAIWTLGRFLKSLRRPMVLVLDQVYLIHDFNILAQFLLLPRQLEMNLTVIVITNNILLDQTRSNMMTSNSTSSLSSCIQPSRIHFPSYRGRTTFEAILLLPSIRDMIRGTDEESKNTGDDFHLKVYKSFVRTLMQSTYDLTKNIKEIVRFGRILWLRYIDPLQSSKIDGTLQSITRKLRSFQPPVNVTPERVEQELLALLDHKVLSQVRSLTDEYLFALSVPTKDIDTHLDMSERAKYLLLAAYLCQVNRPERDKHLFSIQKNGRRRKSVSESNTASEDTAFGVNVAAQPRSLRLRTFPLERMLSVFVSVVALHQMANNKESLPEEDSEQLLSLGDASLQQNLEYLQDVGMLHEQPATGTNDPIRLIGRRYWCELTEAEAMRLADNLQFPLTRYIL